MIVMLPWVYHVNGFVATLEPVFDERKQHSIFFLVAVKKCADMPYFAELGPGKENWSHVVLHGVFLLM
jgi:hypothetical protein